MKKFILFVLCFAGSAQAQSLSFYKAQFNFSLDYFSTTLGVRERQVIMPASITYRSDDQLCVLQTADGDKLDCKIGPAPISAFEYGNSVVFPDAGLLIKFLQKHAQLGVQGAETLRLFSAFNESSNFYFQIQMFVSKRFSNLPYNLPMQVSSVTIETDKMLRYQLLDLKVDKLGF